MSKRTTGTEEPDTQLASQLRASITKLARAQRSERQRDPSAQLPFSLMSALSTLERSGPSTPTELARLEAVRKPSMTRAIATLLEAGLVTRKDHPDDRRQALVTITPAGEKAVAQSRSIVDRWYRNRLQQLDPADRALLTAAAPALVRLSNETA